jgi:hypothetical protein
MTTTLDSKHRAVIKAFKPGDVLEVQEQGDDIVVLKRMKPANAPKPKLVTIKGELFSKGGGRLTNDEVRRIIEDEPLTETC